MQQDKALPQLLSINTVNAIKSNPELFDSFLVFKINQTITTQSTDKVPKLLSINDIENIMEHPNIFNNDLVFRIKENLYKTSDVKISKAKNMKNVRHSISKSDGSLGLELARKSFANINRNSFVYKDLPTFELKQIPLSPPPLPPSQLPTLNNPDNYIKLSFDRKYNDPLHQKYYREIDNGYKCDLCGHITKHRTSIIAHRNLKHTVNYIPKYKCKLCNYCTTDFKSELKKHVQRFHFNKIHLFHENLEEIAEVQEDINRNIMH